MKKRAALVAVVMTAMSLVGAPAANASCTDVGGECIESTLCEVVTGTKPTSGWNCVQ